MYQTRVVDASGTPGLNSPCRFLRIFGSLHGSRSQKCCRLNTITMVSFCATAGWCCDNRLWCNVMLGTVRRRGFRWKLVHDPKFESSRNRARRWIDTLDDPDDNECADDVRRDPKSVTLITWSACRANFSQAHFLQTFSGLLVCRQIHFTREFFWNTFTLCTHHIVAQGVAACALTPSTCHPWCHVFERALVVSCSDFFSFSLSRASFGFWQEKCPGTQTGIIPSQRREIDHTTASDEQLRRDQLLLQEHLSEKSLDLRVASFQISWNGRIEEIKK